MCNQARKRSYIILCNKFSLKVAVGGLAKRGNPSSAGGNYVCFIQNEAMSHLLHIQCMYDQFILTRLQVVNIH